LFEGLFEGAGRFPETRERLADRAEEGGTASLYAELARVDPASAASIHRNDTSRVIRALEVFEGTGRPLSEWQREPSRRPTCSPRYVGLGLDRKKLVARIDRRVDRMMEDGLLEEVESLSASGALSSGMPAASAVGYRELLPLVERGEGSLEGAVERIKVNTRRYAKRQMTWFRGLEDVAWHDADGLDAEHLASELTASDR